MPSRLRLVASLLVLPVLAGCQAAPVQLHESGSAAQTAVITLPEQLEVAAVNGKEIEGASGMLTRGEKTLEVVPGTYELLVFYRELWEWGDHHEVLRSDPALFRITTVAGGRYRIDYERPANLEQARDLVADFNGWVEDQVSGQRIASASSGLQFRRGLVPAVTFDDTLVPTARQGAGGQQAVAPLETEAGPKEETRAEITAETRAEPEVPAAPVQGEWLDLMKTWWNQASSEERREFLRWLAESR